MNNQPAPTPNSHQIIGELVRADINERIARGRAKYGVALQPFNGRKPLEDLYEELLDAVFYLRQELDERGHIITKVRNLVGQCQLGLPGLTAMNNLLDWLNDGCPLDENGLT